MIMGLTTGWILTGISVAGIVGCLAGLIATFGIFSRQRKRLLEEIEDEQEGRR